MSDIASQLSSIAQGAWQTRVDYAVARKILDSGREGGEAAVRLIEAAVKTQAAMASEIEGLGAGLDCCA